MPTARNYDDLQNMKLVQREVGKTYEMRVLSAQKYAAIEKAVQQQSITAALQAQLDANARAHADWLAREQSRITTELANMQRAGASAKSIAARRTTLEKQLAADRAAQEDTLAAKQQSLNSEIARSKQADAQRVANIASRLADAEYSKLSIYQRRQVQQELQDKSHAHAVELQNQHQANAEALKLLRNKARYAVAGSEEEAAYQSQINSLVAEQAQLKSQIKAAESTERAAFAEKLSLQESILRAQREYVLTQPNHNGAVQLLQNIESATDEAKAKLEQLDIEIAVNQKVGLDTSELEREKLEIQSSLDNFNDVMGEAGEALYAAAASDEAQKTHKEAEKELKKVKAQSPMDMARAMNDERDIEKAKTDKQARAQWIQFMSPKGIADNLGKAVANAVENVAAQVSQAINQIDDNINQFYQYQSSVEARLQGSDESYKKSLKTISKNVGLSGLVSQKDVIENIKKLSESGIAYNLDLRAFLATIKDDIAETFDVFDSNLMRLIRLQQSDTTAARLGMEASLNRLFNEYFSDTSYLTDAADSVSQAIIDANSQLTKDMSVEFEYMVQKWLGSLYSLGMDQGTISTIAQGLNFLGTGNVEALNGNESLQSLLAMSASRAGISYADILTGGLDADTTNDLMKSMIEYLKSIAENTDNNQVTKSAYSNVFGFNMSDLTAVSSLSETDIANIHKQSLDYQGAMNEYEYQASQIFNRTHFSQMLDTVFDNAMMSASTAIGNNAGVYATWKVLNVVEDLTGGIAIPGISVMGNMVDLHQTVTGLAKTGIAGLGLMGSLLGSLFNGSLFGTTSVDKWGYDEFTSRGSSTKGISSGTASGVSQSSSMSMVGSASSDDLKSTSMSDATDDAEKDAEITNKNVEDNADIYTKIYEAIADEDTTVLKEVLKLETIVSDGTSALLSAIGTTNELLREERRFKAEMSGMDTMLKMLDPNRIFYSMIVGMLPLTTESFDVDETTHILTVTEAAITTAFEATAHNVAKETTAAIQEITSVANEIQEGNYQHLTAQPVVNPNIDVTVTNPVPDVPSTPPAEADENQVTEVITQDVSQYRQDTTNAITKLESAITSVDTQNIANLMAQTSVGMYDSTDKTTNQLITNDGLKVSINQMSPEVSAYIAATVKSMVSSALTGGTSLSGADEETVSLMDILTTILQNNTMNVNVTNTDFDAAMQKTAFTS